jgi:Predicted hydrolases of the HAD superfamily
MRAKIIAVDFDGTLVENKWPDIGATNEKVLDYCKSERAKGARIILWTNRVGEPLTNAIKWCQDHGLLLDAINDNIQESIDFFGFNTRKIYADEFIDDRMAKGFDLPYVPKKSVRIKEMSPKELLKLYREKYMDGRDPIISYWVHETMPNAIKVEHHSGFVREFYVVEEAE